MVQRAQRGTVYEVRDAKGRVVSFHIKYRVTEMRDGKPVRVQRSHKLMDRDNRYFSASCKAVVDKADEFMRTTVNSATTEDLLITNFWTDTYLPFIEQNKKPSTVAGYRQIWEQHLKDHFTGKTLQEYRTFIGAEFFLKLTKTQGRRTLNHIRSLMSGIFQHALNLGKVTVNPCRGIKYLGKVKEPKATAHYTLEEAEDIISALVEHPDCQLIMALSCFLGLRPGEIAGLKWEDFDETHVHIRRAVVRGIVGTTKTPESVASLPLFDRVSLFVELWRGKCTKSKEGWVFANERGNPVSLRDVVARTIRPAVEKANLQWRGLYAGRRGAGTAIIGLTNGNYAAAQELLRHKHMSTTLQFYKKQTKSALNDGIKALESALKPKQLGAGEGSNG